MPQFAFSLKALTAACMLVSSVQTFALEEMKEQEMSEATGEGVGFVLEDFKIAADPTTYVRVTSAGGTAAETGKKAELYLYGLSLGGDNGNNDANVSGANIGTFDNPIVFSAKEIDGQSALLLDFPKVADGTHPANSKAGKNLKLVTQVDVLPRDGLIFTANREGYPSYLRMQVMANKVSLDGTKVRIIKTGEFNPGESITTGSDSFDRALVNEQARMTSAYSNKVANYGKLRINYETDGFFKWSVAQNEGATGTDPVAVNNTDALGNGYGAYVTNTPGQFNDKEGLFVQDFQINMPLGSSFQPTVLDTNGDGSIVLEVARIPNDPKVYQKQYINYVDKTYVNVAKGEQSSLTFDPAKRSLVESNSTVVESNTPDVIALTKEQGYCTPTNCPNTATHATVYFRTFTHDKNGDSSVDYPQAGASEPYVPFQYRGYGVKPLPSDTSGSAGIGPNGAFNPMVANTAPTYNLVEGMVVNHLKVTLNQ